MSDVPEGMTRIVPMLAYEDVERASGWLQQAFGFRERQRYADDDGTVSQAELEADGGVLMIANPGPAYQEPRHHAETCATARAWSEVPYVIDGVHMYVTDVDAHHARSRDAGARILSEPEDTPYGDRRYRAEDPAGPPVDVRATPLRGAELGGAPLRCGVEASGFLVGPAVFKTVVGAKAPRRVRFPSASAMPSRRSPLVLVAAVVLAASLLLALTLPDREPPVIPCPIGRIDPDRSMRTRGRPADPRTRRDRAGRRPARGRTPRGRRAHGALERASRSSGQAGAASPRRPATPDVERFRQRAQAGHPRHTMPT